jgi:CTP synthase
MLLKSRGLTVTAQKFDPYINVDPGTMSPYQHGEVFVTEDGAETDLDLGHYERFIDENLTKFSNLTAGKVYWNVIKKERNGEYLGSTVQVIPHITNEIKSFVYSLAESTKADVVITETGGTIGDIEIQPFIEAIRQISMEVGTENCLFIHVTLVPFISNSDEYKSKPTQHSVKELRSLGINPGIIVVRCNEKLGEKMRSKIALFCSVKPDCVIENTTMPSLYHVPMMLEESNFSDIVVRELSLNCKDTNLFKWKKIVNSIENFKKTSKIAIVGKYVGLHDAYLSVIESLNHAGIKLGIKPEIKWVNSESLTDSTVSGIFSDCNGIIIPGGFGSRGIEGKIVAAKYARENKVPYLGICLGMQIAAIEFARNKLNIADANSREFKSNSKNFIIDLMNEQREVLKKGGTMRLGSYLCKIKENSFLHKIYNKTEISERHRHRYEFNNEFRKDFEKNGMIISGVSPDEILAEAIELKDHPFFIGVQFHPEFKSRPNRVHPLFLKFLEVSTKR